ncbi:hypothetical protein GCM10027612_26430 [Microbispora bryophytorum subsp. camponoti]|uniref:Uncharacterized protein n=1 Tax=Microbispora bryophytorum TaxID=1460882 RepID=A0A8H9L9C1_9ACTN|nr:hypothetical protein GCM10011574_18260 [Microbispora bryophytorum]
MSPVPKWNSVADSAVAASATAGRRIGECIVQPPSPVAPTLPAPAWTHITGGSDPGTTRRDRDRSETRGTGFHSKE